MQRSAYREAAVSFEQALAALGHLPESRERLEQAIDLHLDACGALVPTALAKVQDHLREAEALAEALGDERRLGWVLLFLSDRAWLSGNSDWGSRGWPARARDRDPPGRRRASRRGGSIGRPERP